MKNLDNHPDIRAVFFDVDGTLYSHSANAVPESTKRAFKKLREKGIKTVVATGRHMIELSGLPVMELPFDCYITLNGQLLLDENRNYLMGTPIDEREMDVIVQIFNGNKIPFMLVGQDNRYINHLDQLVIDTQFATKGTIPSIDSYRGEKIYQILAFVPEHQKEILSDFLDFCVIKSWHPTGIDIIPINGGKSVGIRKYVESIGVDMSQTMGFGDAENDIDMLEHCGIGVAMGNGTEACKNSADYVTDTVDNDGIEKALIHFGIID